MCFEAVGPPRTGKFAESSALFLRCCLSWTGPYLTWARGSQAECTKWKGCFHTQNYITAIAEGPCTDEAQCSAEDYEWHDVLGPKPLLCVGHTVVRKAVQIAGSLKSFVWVAVPLVAVVCQFPRPSSHAAVCIGSQRIALDDCGPSRTRQRVGRVKCPPLSGARRTYRT